jgi:hypothetical protein
MGSDLEDMKSTEKKRLAEPLAWKDLLPKKTGAKVE